MGTPYIKERHDFGITRTNGTVVGFVLAKDNNEAPLYQEFRDPYLANQFFSGVAGYGSLPADKELALRQDDWRSGFGLEHYSENDPQRYYNSIGMDMRFAGMAIAGPTSTFCGVPQKVEFTSDSDASGDWTNESNAYDEDDTTAATCALAELSTWEGYLQLNCEAINVDRILIKLDRDNARIDDVEVGVYYDDGWHTLSDPTYGSWNNLAIGATKSVDKIRIRFHHSGSVGSNTGSVYEVFMIQDSGVGNVVALADFNDALYCAVENIIGKLNAGGTEFDYVNHVNADITDLEPFPDGKLYVACGTSHAYYEMNTSEALTKNTLSNNQMQFMVTVNTTAPTMYGNDGGNTVRLTTNPADGGSSWSNQTIVGESHNVITGLLPHNGALHIMKEDVPYYLDSDGNPKTDLAPELGTLKSSTSGKNSVEWLGNLYVQAGTGALMEIGSLNTWRNPSDFATNLAESTGAIQALATDERYLFAIIDNSTKIEVLAGRQERVGSTTTWVWHPIHELTLTGCETAYVSTVVDKRLWISSTSSGDRLYYIKLPTSYGNILADSNRTFLTGTTMETPFLHGNFKNTPKEFPELQLVMGHAYDVNIYFTVKYKKLGDTSWTTIGNYTGTSSSMVESKFIPVDGSGNNPVSTLFKLQFTAVTDDATKTPQLLSYNLTGILRPPQRRVIACVVRVADEMTDKDGILIKGDHDEMVATLDEAMTATWPVTIKDIDGNTETVNFLPVSPYWKPTRGEKDRRNFEREYNLLLQVVDLS